VVPLKGPPGHKKAFNLKVKGYITNTMNNTKFFDEGKKTLLKCKDNLFATYTQISTNNELAISA
jgi:hypothetical protein